jgi:hypothetical protein
MSCCGQKRSQQRQTSNAFVHDLAAPRASTGRFPMGRAYFEYIGLTAITVVGNVTGQQYRFATPSVPVAVDARDRGSLTGVPLLREVR